MSLYAPSDLFCCCRHVAAQHQSTHATTKTSKQAPEPWQFYSTLRTIDPAPYAAWLSLAGSAAAAGITVCGSSHSLCLYSNCFPSLTRVPVAPLLLAASPPFSTHTQPPKPWQFYSTLRTINLAPYPAWLNL